MIASVAVVPLLDHRVKIYRFPPDSLECLGLEQMPAVEPELDHVLPQSISPEAAACTEADMIVHATFVHNRAPPKSVVAFVTPCGPCRRCR
jgi:hypothetical protein